MEDIEKARAVRSLVLAQTDSVERIDVTIFGAEHKAWRVDGSGWYALVSNAWDLHVAACRSEGEQLNKREAVIDYELLELVVDRQTVLSFFCRIDGTDEHLIEYVAGEWEELFMPAPKSATTLLRAA